MNQITDIVELEASVAAADARRLEQQIADRRAEIAEYDRIAAMSAIRLHRTTLVLLALGMLLFCVTPPTALALGGIAVAVPVIVGIMLVAVALTVAQCIADGRRAIPVLRANAEEALLSLLRKQAAQQADAALIQVVIMTQPRQPKGRPTGGEFAAHDRADGDVSLAGTHRTITGTADASWVEKELPSPRHRNPVDVTKRATVDVEIPDLTSDEAPVAMAFSNDGVSHDSGDEFRVHDGKLFQQLGWPRTDVAADPTWLGSALSDEGKDRAEAERLVRENAARHIAVDGKVWEEVPYGEPMYEVRTFGLGGNHGGTSIGYATHVNSNVGRDNYFLADEFEQAKQHAIDVATNRGDTESIARIEAFQPMTVNDTSAIGRYVPRIVRIEVPETDYRPEYGTPEWGDTDLYAKGEVKFLIEQERTLRERLEAAPGAIVEADGQRRINFDAFSESQQARIKRLLAARAELGIL